MPRSLNVIFNSIVGRVYTQNNIKPHRCVDFTRLTKDQQEEEAKIKKNLLRRFKEVPYNIESISFFFFFFYICCNQCNIGIINLKKSLCSLERFAKKQLQPVKFGLQHLT